MYLLSIYIASQIKDNAQFLSFYTHYTSDQTSIVFSSLNIRKKELYSNIFVFFFEFQTAFDIAKQIYFLYTLQLSYETNKNELYLNNAFWFCSFL